MRFGVVKGKVKTWGDGVTRTGSGHISKTIYSWLEMSDGMVIKKFTLLTGVGGRFEAAMKAGEEIEFHLAEFPGDAGPENTVIAVKGADGRLFAIDANMPGGSSFLFSMGPVIYGLIGAIFTLTIFGAVIGIPLLILAHRIHAKGKNISQVRNYLRKLPNAITV